MLSVESAGLVQITDYGSTAIKAGAEFIEQVLEPEELAQIMDLLHRTPWLRSSRAALVKLHELGYQKLKNWFSTELGERVESLYLGNKPRRKGMFFDVVVAGKKVPVDHIDTAWDEDCGRREYQPHLLKKQLIPGPGAHRGRHGPATSTVCSPH